MPGRAPLSRARLTMRSRWSPCNPVARAGTDRIVLTRCDSPGALDWGRALGITLFQGRHVDRLHRSEADAPPLPAYPCGEPEPR